VSFLKAPAAQDGHPRNSDPTDEQDFLVKEINSIEKSPEWKNTAIVINYDDSDGWYDHVAPTIINGSADAANNAVVCTSGPAAAGGYLDRCGPSQRIPMLVVSPFAKQNFIDHTVTNQASVLKFIEDNWSTGRVGDSSFDAAAGTLDTMFDFAHPQQRAVLLANNGSVASVVPVSVSSGNVNTTAPAVSDPILPITGARIAWWSVAGAALLLAAGLVLVLMRRRSRAARH
jgi:phospholipase C